MTNSYFTSNNIAVIEIPEALPRSKVGLMPEAHERWLNYVHCGIIRLTHNNQIPKFEKALVGIHVVIRKESDKGRLWDVSNRAVNLIINNLKGIFFPDDNFRHMTLTLTGAQGENEKTLIYVGDFITQGIEIFTLMQQEINGSYAS